jgi:hypothetical protein
VQVLSAYFRTYIGELEKLQLDITTKNDLIGVDDSRISGIFSRRSDALKNRSAVFALGDRANVLKVRDGQTHPCSLLTFTSLEAGERTNWLHLAPRLRGWRQVEICGTFC